MLIYVIWGLVVLDFYNIMIRTVASSSLLDVTGIQCGMNILL